MTLSTTTNLLQWQQDAVGKLLPLRVGALYMDMGTGKTRTALELIVRRYNAGKIDRVLWLCPYSIQQNIIDDLNKHATGWESVIKVAGIESLSNSTRIVAEQNAYVSTGTTMLVVDESSLVKNHTAIRSQVIDNLAKQCKYRIILNGTPISKNEKDLYMQWRILDKRILGYNSFWSFSANHLEYDDKGRVRRCLHVDTLTDKISPYTYQVRRDDCMSLPPKHYEHCYFNLDEDMDIHYHEKLEEHLLYMDDYKPETLYKLFSAMQTITSGNIIMTHPRQRMRTVQAYAEPEQNPRIREMIRVVKRLQDEKCIIYCKYQQEVNDVLATLRADGYTAAEFTGEMNSKRRDASLAGFRNDVQFLVANKSCAAFGLNLQHCCNEIFYNNDWDYATRIQAEDRVHRLGQEHDVYIYDVYATDTIDERIIECLSRKQRLLDTFQDSVDEKQDMKTSLREFCSKRVQGKPVKKP